MPTNRFLIMLSILATTACNPFHRGQAVEVSAGDATLNSTWHANLASPASLAGVVQMNGSASMAPDASGTRTVVVLSLANATPGGLHPWEVHEGQCGASTDYGVFGSSAAYKPVQGRFRRPWGRDGDSVPADAQDRQLLRGGLRVGSELRDGRGLR